MEITKQKIIDYFNSHTKDEDKSETLINRFNFMVDKLLQLDWSKIKNFYIGVDTELEMIDCVLLIEGVKIQISLIYDEEDNEMPMTVSVNRDILYQCEVDIDDFVTKLNRGLRKININD